VRLFGFEVPAASSSASRLLGLAFLDRDRVGEGLLITRRRSVHTFGMRFPLDLVFLDAGGQVLEVRRNVAPRRICRCPGAAAVLELPTA
jgi:uncharacterized protein